MKKVTSNKAPICVRADGVNVLDDVGGIYGFIDMLETIHGNRLALADEKREWAREQGWTGRLTKVGNML